jgi:choline dehydrogenase-like flavoprotein
LFDFVIVGAGAAAASVALGLQGKRVLMLDAGGLPQYQAPMAKTGFYEMRRQSEDLFGYLIGDRLESLVNVHGGSISPKLKSPGMSFVTRDWQSHVEIKGQNFSPEISLAKGGFANAWGAGCFRYVGRELEHFPLAPGCLEPYYDRLTREIGISGEDDDLKPFFGSATDLQPALELHPLAGSFLQRYRSRRARLQRKGYFVGRPRLAVLTRDLPDRTAYDYGTLDFFQPYQPAVYTPAFTIDPLIQRGALTYVPDILVDQVLETDSGVEVLAHSLSDPQSKHRFSARRCVLAAGAIGTAQLALRSFGQAQDRLPLRENPTTLMVLFDPRFLGKAQRFRGFGGCQLSLIYQNQSGECFMSSLYDLGAVLRTDVLFDLPLPAGSLLGLSRSLLSAFLVLQVFYPDCAARASGSLSLDSQGALNIAYETEGLAGLESTFMWDLLGMGYLTAPPMWKRPVPGQCFHYAGTLPLAEHPGRLECWPDGRLACCSNVYVADASTFPRLPSKNLTFTAMANALRIADGLLRL